VERRGEEIHVTTTEARSGFRGTHVRNILLISLVLAIAAMSAVWIIPALNSSQHPPDNATVDERTVPVP